MILASKIDPHGIAASMELRKDIYDVIMKYRPSSIIETGTYNGLGSTSAILHGLKDANIQRFSFISIECNPHNYAEAQKNIGGEKYDGTLMLMNAVSVPRELLPIRIEDNFPPDVITDHVDSSRYIKEIPNNVQDDGLMTALHLINFAPDLVLLDSAGHLGEVEFDYVISLVDSSFILILDDIKHRKHYNTMRKIRGDKRYEIIKESDNKFGHAIIFVK